MAYKTFLSGTFKVTFVGQVTFGAVRDIQFMPKMDEYGPLTGHSYRARDSGI